jgi:Uma2 family endonuclease
MGTRTERRTAKERPPSPRTVTRSGLVLYRLTVRQFERMIDSGILSDSDHVELIGGLLVDKMTKNDPHDFTVGALGEALHRIVAPDCVVREEKSIVVGRYSRPEPDVAVARGPRERYRSAAPKPPDLPLLIEVADSSYPQDRGSKWSRYAAARVPVYWIVNLLERRIEVYSKPSGRGNTAAYQVTETFGPTDEVPVILDGREQGRVKVREILP